MRLCYKPWLKADYDNACRAVGRSWVSRCARVYNFPHETFTAAPKKVLKKFTSTIALENQIARKKSLSYYDINNRNCYKSNGHTYQNNALLPPRGMTRTMLVLSLWHQLWEEVKV